MEPEGSYIYIRWGCYSKRGETRNRGKREKERDMLHM